MLKIIDHALTLSALSHLEAIKFTIVDQSSQFPSTFSQRNDFLGWKVSQIEPLVEALFFLFIFPVF